MNQQNNDKKDGGMIKLAGLWLQKGKDGTGYMSGTVGGVKVLVFKNTRKEPGSNQPDYNVFLASAPPPKKPAPNWNQKASEPQQEDDGLPF